MKGIEWRDGMGLEIKAQITSPFRMGIYIEREREDWQLGSIRVSRIEDIQY